MTNGSEKVGVDSRGDFLTKRGELSKSVGGWGEKRILGCFAERSISV